jgi:RNA polymerase sigma-70 factor (ECF subfamily)
MFAEKEKQMEAYLEDFRKGRESAFDDIAQLIASDIMRIAYRYVGNVDDAKDVCQNVLFNIYKNLHRFRHRSRLSTWVYRITANAAIDFLRRRKPNISFDESIAGQIPVDSDVKENIERHAKEQQLKKLIAELPLRQKNVLILKHFEGLKIREISKVLGCSQSSVKTHLTRAIQNLKKNVGGG